MGAREASSKSEQRVNTPEPPPTSPPPTSPPPASSSPDAYFSVSVVGECERGARRASSSSSFLLGHEGMRAKECVGVAVAVAVAVASQQEEGEVTGKTMTTAWGPIKLSGMLLHRMRRRRRRPEEPARDDDDDGDEDGDEDE